MDKKKVLITASTFPRWDGDTEPRFILDLAKNMRDYFDITVLAPAYPGVKEQDVLEGVKVIRYHYFFVHKFETLCYPGAIVPRIKEKKSRILLVPFLFLGLWIKLLKIAKEYDVIHAHWIIPQGIVQACFAVPYIITGHGGDVTSLNNKWIKNLKINTLKKAKAVTVVSNELKGQLGKYFDTKNVRVVSMGCDTVKFNPRNRIENYFGQNDKKVVLFVGRLAEKKGVRYLIDAARNVDAKFVIVGDGPLRAELEELAKELNDKVAFVGAKTHAELSVIYASADIFVAPSITAKDGDKEGLPTTITEAMASGLPVIGSDSGGIKEIVCHGENGFVVAEKDSKAIAYAINMLLEDAAMYSILRENAINTAKTFDYSVIGKKYAEIIEEVIRND